MAVLKCELLDAGRSISRDERGRYSYGAVYRVTTDDKDDDAIVVQEDAELASPDPLPQHMSVYALGGSTDVSAFCQSLQGVQGNGASRKLWEFTVGWSPLPPGKSPLETQTSFDDPILRPQRYWSEFQTITEVIEKDAADNPIVNTAGQPFDEPAEEDNEYEVMVFEKNFATAGEIRVLNRSFRRRRNSDVFGGYAAKHCLCLPIRTGPPQFESGVTYYRATFRIICSDRPWTREFVNRGFKHFADVVPEGGGAAEKKLVLARDPVINPDTGKIEEYALVSEPVLLTDGTEANSPGAGYRLSDLDPDLPGNVVSFDTRPDTAFSGLPVTPPT